MKNIHESISNLLSQKLEKYKKKNLSSETCIQIYQEIFDTFVEMSGIKIFYIQPNLDWLKQALV